MVLNYIWIFFFGAAFIVALCKLIFMGDTEVFSAIVKATFDMSKTGFEISLGLTGVLTLWMGIMKIGERGGAVKVMSWLISPFFRKLFPELPPDSPAYGSIMMNIAANMLGLDNAATPVGLKAMQQMQEVNPHKERASNAQIMFGVEYFRPDDYPGFGHGVPGTDGSGESGRYIYSDIVGYLRVHVSGSNCGGSVPAIEPV